MRSFTLLIFCCFIFQSHLWAQGKKTEYNVAIIGFYNLENLFDTLNDPLKNDEDFTPSGVNRYDSRVYQSKMENLSRVIAEMGADITPDGPALLGLAEVECVKPLEDLVKQPAIRHRNYKPILVEGPDERGIDVGLLYQPKYFTLLATHSLPVVLGNNGNSYDRTRDVLWVHGLLDGEPVHVFVNHWPSRRGGEEASAPKRQIAAGVCKKIIDSLSRLNPNVKCIVMGDLNDDPTNTSVRKILNAACEQEDVQPGKMFNPFCKMYKNGIGTLAYGDSWNLFDQHVLSAGFLQKQNGFFFHKAVVFNRDYMMQKFGNFKGYPLRTYVGSSFIGGYSDHFPTYVIYLKEKKK